MESPLLLHHGGFKAFPSPNRVIRYPKPPISPHRFAVLVMAGPRNGLVTKPVKPTQEKKTVYSDNWFDRLAIQHISKSIQLTTGIKSDKEGYEGFVSAASSVARNFDAKEQHELVMQALRKAFPKAILDMIKLVTPPSKFTREFFAVFTILFFPFLVGKCEVRESEFEGKREKNVVYIPKCRFLEETNCVGMCTALCKMPSQEFIHGSLGMPVNMVPNFEDMSCEMIFGQHPPEDDPALKQPCYKKLCIAKQTHGVNCSS